MALDKKCRAIVFFHGQLIEVFSFVPAEFCGLVGIQRSGITPPGGKWSSVLSWNIIRLASAI
jgi:hypothetical protein